MIVEAEPGRSVVEAREAFAVYLDGHPFTVVSGDRFYADDPVVVGREVFFGPLHVRTSAMPTARGSKTTAAAAETADAVADGETADATPGTRRATRRGKGGTS